MSLQLLNLDLTAEKGQHQAGRMSELIPSLQSAFLLTNDRGITDAAIIAGQTAIETIPADHPTYPLLMANLALSLHARFERVGDPVDADDAIEFIQRAIATEPHQGRHKSVLVMVLFERYRHAGGRADLEGAIASGRDALMADLRPDEKYAAMNNLAHSLHTRFDLTGAETDLDEGGRPRR